MLEYAQQEQRQLPPQLSAETLGSALRFKGFKVLEQNDETIRFSKVNTTKPLA